MMAVRTSMQTLIDRVNALCNNALNANLTFANQDVQDCLDRFRQESRYEDLDAIPTTLYGGTIYYVDFQARGGMWEGGTAYSGGSAGYLLCDGNYGTVTPSSADLLTGRFRFAGTAGPNGLQGPYRPVMITGWRYDIYAAAAELLLLRCAQVSEDFDFSTSEGLKYSRSQKLALIEGVRKDFLAKAIFGVGGATGGGFARRDTLC